VASGLSRRATSAPSSDATPDSGDDLRARAERLATRTGVDATAIWEWGTIYRVTSGLYCRTIRYQPFGDLLLAEADRLTG
jgi:streptomycin 6-kinase